MMYNLTRLLPAALHFQALLPGFPRYSSNATSYMSAGMTALNVDRTLAFWFDGEDRMQKWFRPAPGFDQEIRDKFGDLMDQARTTHLDLWTQTPTSSLALTILLDQFPRNVWRNTPDAFSSDSKALQIATRSIIQEFDREVTPSQQLFFYLPLMHDETLVSQVAVASLLEGALGRLDDADSEDRRCLTAAFDNAKQHASVISRFGRFPSRNAALGRETTKEEEEFLKEFPGGF